MDKATIEKALHLLGEEAVKAGMIVDLSVYGGSALSIAYNFRDATRDVDAVFEKEKQFVGQAAAVVAEKLGLVEGWINDAMKGYLSRHDDESKVLFRTYPSEANPGLRVFIPTPEYMLALKCIDIRTSPSAKDVGDVRMLLKQTGARTTDEVMSIVTSFYPVERILPKTMYAIEEIIQNPDDKKLPQVDVAFGSALRQHVEFAAKGTKHAIKKT